MLRSIRLSISKLGNVIEDIAALSSSISVAMEQQDAVTSEIARTVEESAQAARELATQIVKVSQEVAETGRRAHDIQTASADIADKVAGLQSVLVQVVRTSTIDVNRQLHERIDLGRAATLEVMARPCAECLEPLGRRRPVALLPFWTGLSTKSKSVATILIDGISAGFGGVVDWVDSGRETVIN